LSDRKWLDGKVAIVTGASRGIGSASARAFAASGATVVLAARTAEAIATVADEINAAGARALAIPTDVTDPESVQRLVEKTVATFGRLDVAFNNVGAGHMPTPLADISFEDFEVGLKANLGCARTMLEIGRASPRVEGIPRKRRAEGARAGGCRS